MIKKLRELTGLSQQAFSDKYEIPKRTIEDWERGRRNPPGYVVKLLERVVKGDIEKEG
nr:helix-turn-helix domain-containing protein [uncultured Blautia sp.]